MYIYDTASKTSGLVTGPRGLFATRLVTETVSEALASYIFRYYEQSMPVLRVAASSRRSPERCASWWSPAVARPLGSTKRLQGPQ